MKGSTSSFHLVAIASASSTPFMSLRPTYRRGRNQCRTTGVSGCGGKRFYSEDSRFRWEGDTNLGFQQQVENGSSRSCGSFIESQPQPSDSERGYNQRPPLNRFQAYDQNHPINIQTQPVRSQPLPYNSNHQPSDPGRGYNQRPHFDPVPPPYDRNQRFHRSPHINHNPPLGQPPPPYNSNRTVWQSQPQYSDHGRGTQPPSNYSDQTFWQSQPQSYDPGSGYNQRPSFNPFPPYNQNQPFHRSLLTNQNPPPVRNPSPNNSNQAFWQSQPSSARHPMLSDRRNWEYARHGIPPCNDRFIILSYNILADYLAISHHRKLYYHIPPQFLDWEWRKRSIIFELGLWSADIMCFQEVDRFQDLEVELKPRGYHGIWKMRTGNAIDGCAIFWRASRFNLLHEECIEFNKFGMRNNVCQICVLELMNQDYTKKASALPTSSTSSNKVVICNIHVLYNPKRGEIKLGQVRELLHRAHSVSKIWNNAPVVLCGDFNCTPKSPLYNFISGQKLILSELDRDKVSGQASAEIRAVKPRSPNPSIQFADKSSQATMMSDDRKIDTEQRNSVLNMQKQNNPDSSVGDIPVMNGLSQLPCEKAMLVVSDNSCLNGQRGDEYGALSDEVSNETLSDTIVSTDQKQNNPDSSLGNVPVMKGLCVLQCENAMPVVSDNSCLNVQGEGDRDLSDEVTKQTLPDTIGVSIDQADPNVCIPHDRLKENKRKSPNCGEFQSEQMAYGNNDETEPRVSSHYKIICSDMIKQGLEEKADVSFPVNGSFSQHIKSNTFPENESMQCNEGASSYVGDDYSAKAKTDLEHMNISISDASSSELFHQSSFPSVIEPSTSGSSGSISLSIANDENGSESNSCQLPFASNIDSMLDEKSENSAVHYLDEERKEGETSCEDCELFLFELLGTEDSFPSNFAESVRGDAAKFDHSKRLNAAPHNLTSDDPSVDVVHSSSLGMDSVPADAERTTYDPSAWTALDIATATGSADCNVLEHALKMKSTYAETEDHSGTRDSNGEPLVTSYNRCFLGTVDYIWRSEGLQTVRVLAPLRKDAMQWTQGYPTKKWGSDHIALASELAFAEVVIHDNMETQ